MQHERSRLPRNRFDPRPERLHVVVNGGRRRPPLLAEPSGETIGIERFVLESKHRIFIILFPQYSRSRKTRARGRNDDADEEEYEKIGGRKASSSTSSGSSDTHYDHYTKLKSVENWRISLYLIKRKRNRQKEERREEARAFFTSEQTTARQQQRQRHKTLLSSESGEGWFARRSHLFIESMSSQSARKGINMNVFYA